MLTKQGRMCIIIHVAREDRRQTRYADVAELADALDSGSSSLKRVWVQIPSSAPKSRTLLRSGFFFKQETMTERGPSCPGPEKFMWHA